MSSSLTVQLLLTVTLALPTSAIALDVKRIDDVAFMSGDLDPKDRSALKEALAGAKALVVGEITGSVPIHVLPSFATLISGSGVPTVNNGRCSWACTYFFMAGKTRLFGISEPPQRRVILFSQMTEVSNRGLSVPWEGSYTLFSNQFGQAMPRSLLRKYTERTIFPEGMLAFPPSAEHPEGYFRECTDVRDANTCQTNSDITPLNTGMITSAEPFPVPSP